MPGYTFPYSGRQITWSGGSGAFGPGPDGTLMIQGTQVVVDSTTPDWDDSNGYHGAVVGLPGSREQSGYGFDRRISMTGARDSLPLTINVGEAAVLVESKPSSEMVGGPYNSTVWTTGPTSYHGSGARTVIKYMDAVVVVPYDPTNAANTMLTPPLLGVSDISKFLRQFNVAGAGIPQAILNYNRLPSVVDLDAIATELAIPVTNFDTLLTDLTAIYQNMMGDIYSGWATDTATPGFSHPGYGSFLAACNSQASVILASTRYSVAQKTPLARAMAQAGLHLIGGMFDGRRMWNNGGHGEGRKHLICMFGFLSGINEFLYLNDAFLSDPAGTPFPENGRYFPIQWFDGAAAGKPFTNGWRFDSGPNGINNPLMNGSQLANPPSTWGDPNAPGHDTWAWAFKSYMPPTVGSNIGTALFWNLVGEEYAWSREAVGFVRQWMTPSPTSMPVHTQLAAAGIDFSASTPAWGEDYGYNPGIDGMCSEAWKAHAVGIVTDSPPGPARGEG